jgi:hypothetical protein
MRYVLLAASLAAVPLSPLASQAGRRTEVGGLIGYSLVGGGDSRTVVGSNVTGAGQPGLHLRAMVAVPLTASPFAFQGELFYNRLSSAANTYAIVGKAPARSALVDETLGLTGSFVATTSRTARFAPYFALGAGLFAASLGSNPDPLGTRVTHTDRGMGLGLVAGAGLRWRVGRPTLLLDYRYYQGLHNTRGSSFMPLSLGLAF